MKQALDSQVPFIVLIILPPSHRSCFTKSARHYGAKSHGNKALFGDHDGMPGGIAATFAPAFPDRAGSFIWVAVKEAQGQIAIFFCSRMILKASLVRSFCCSLSPLTPRKGVPPFGKE